MKRLFIFGVLIVGLSLYSCSNSSSSNGESYAGFISNAETPRTTMDGKVLSDKDQANAAEEKNESGIDTDAYSDSKGVGEFTDVEISDEIDDAMASKGEELFQASCTACHLTSKKILVGPGLEGITKLRTPEWILNMITTPMKMTKEDPVAKQLKKEFNGVQMTNQGLTKDDARDVYEYLRQNDGV